MKLIGDRDDSRAKGVRDIRRASAEYLVGDYRDGG